VLRFSLPQPESHVDPHDAALNGMITAMQTSYRAAVTMKDSDQEEQPDAVVPEPQELNWGATMLSFWMDGTMQPSQQEVLALEPPFFRYLRAIDNGGPVRTQQLSLDDDEKAAGAGQQPDTREGCLLRYLGVDYSDVHLRLFQPPKGPPRLTVERVLAGSYDASYLQEKFCPLELDVRMSALGLTLNEVERNRGLRHLHGWSFANYVHQYGRVVGSDRDAHFCKEETCSRATSFRHFASLPELEEHWQKQIGEVRRDLAQISAAAAAREIGPASSSSSGLSSAPASQAVRACLHPLLPSDNDPLGVALATVVLNRPALLWEALHLRQYLARHFERTSNQQWTELMLDLKFVSPPIEMCPPLFSMLTSLFPITVVCFTEGRDPYRWISKLERPSLVYFWMPILPDGSNRLIPLLQIGRGGDGQLAWHFQQPLPNRRLVPNFDFSVYPKHVWDLEQRWVTALETAVRASPQLRAPWTQPAGGESMYAALVRRAPSLLRVCDGSTVVAELQLRQVVAHTVRTRSERDPDDEHLAFHILNPSTLATKHQGERDAIAEFFSLPSLASESAAGAASRAF